MELRDGILHNDDGTPYNDVLYGQIPAEQLHVDLINTNYFQRMGNILQNGFSYMDFPDMESHTRMGHSIGAFHKTSKILDARKRRNVVHPAYQRIARVQALLHDLGHAPLSHALEPVLGIKHEKRTTQIITGDTDVNRVLTKHGFSDQEIELLSSKNTGFLGKVLDGSIDVDKQDYLPRDAHYAGKKLGTNFDNIMQALIVAFNESGSPEICIDKKYLTDVDQMISDRRWMYQNVYFSDAPMAAESALLPMLTEYVPFLIRNGFITETGLHPIIQKVLMKDGELRLPEFLHFDERLWNTGLNVLAQKNDKLLKYMLGNRGKDAIKDFTVSYISEKVQEGPDVPKEDIGKIDHEGVYAKKRLETFGDSKAKSFGLTKRTASYRTYKEGGIRVAYPDGSLRELANESASLREAADTQIVDSRICENSTIIKIEQQSHLDEKSPLGQFLHQASQTNNDINKDSH
ncbi:MAG: hypothetical protein FWE16_01870 [Firmicutes bacterium]|nr:hypothetical protein [Bacillota bacterium]